MALWSSGRYICFNISHSMHVTFLLAFRNTAAFEVTQLLREEYSWKRTIAPFVSKISFSRLFLYRFSESLLYVDPSQFRDDGHSYTSNSIERKEGNVHFRAIRPRTRHDRPIVFPRLSLWPVANSATFSHCRTAS